MKKLHILLLSTLMCVGLSACSTGDNNTSSSDTVYNPFASKDESSDDSEKTKDSNKSSSKSDENLIEIEDLDWKVEEGMYNNERQLLFGYTNNSDYDVLDFNISFSLKSDVTEEEMKLFDDIKDFDDQPLTNDLKKSLYLKCPDGNNDNVFVKNTERLPSKPCYLGSGNELIKPVNIGIDRYNLMNPDSAKIKYVYDEKIYSVNYDFKNNSYTEEATKKAYSWTNNKMANLLPKPALDVGEVFLDTDDTFMFTGYGVDQAYYQEYVEQCKSKGFDVDQYGIEYYYTASNSDGYELQLSFNNNHISINLSSPKEQK